MQVTRQSQSTGNWNTLELDVTNVQLLQYERKLGAIQDIFPNLAAPYREFIKTGITPKEWKAQFGDPFGINQKCINEQSKINRMAKKKKQGHRINDDDDAPRYKEDGPIDPRKEYSPEDDYDDEQDHFGNAPELPTQEDEPRSYAEDDSDSDS